MQEKSVTGLRRLPFFASPTLTAEPGPVQNLNRFLPFRLIDRFLGLSIRPVAAALPRIALTSTDANTPASFDRSSPPSDDAARITFWEVKNCGGELPHRRRGIGGRRGPSRPRAGASRRSKRLQGGGKALIRLAGTSLLIAQSPWPHVDRDD